VYSPVRLLAILIAVVFAAEFSIMVALTFLPPLPWWLENTLDASLLAILLFPIIYFLVFKPLSLLVAQQVRMRTELEIANKTLQQDIAERNRFMALQKASESKFRILFESANDCLMLLSMDGRILDINQSGHERLGYTKEEMLGRRISEFDPPEFADKVPERVAKIMRDGQATFESAHVRKDGSRMPVEINSRQVEMDGNKMLFSVIRDISKRKAAEEALVKSEANLRAMMDNSPYLTWLKDPEGHYLKINKVFADYLRLKDAAQAVGKTDLELNPKELAEKYRADDAEVMASRKQKHVEEQAFDGKKVHWLETYKTPILDAQGNVLGTVGFASDVTERKQAEADLRIASVAFESQEAMMVTDANSVILRVNQAFTTSTGYSAEELIGQTPRVLKSGHHDAAFYAAMWETIRRTGSWQGEIWDRRKNGEIYPKMLTITAIKDANGTVTHYVGAHTDITERKLAEEEIKSLAFYDPLTQLPNRRLLIDRLQQALASSARSGREGALMFIDLDNFKTLNDTLGHDIGDILLQQVAQRLTSCVREGDSVARLGGDEFVVMLEDLSGPTMEAAEQAEVVGEKILAALNLPYQLAGHDSYSTTSIGVTLFNGHKQSTDELMKQADIAMYQAKKAGRNTLRFFDPQMQETITARVTLEKELRNALENRQFRLFYQIQVDSSHHPFGAEVLIRWQHPERGLVNPGDFIPLAEESGLILPIGEWVLEAACAQLKAWEQDALTRDLVLSVNVSAKQFHQTDFVTQVKSLVQRHAINPELLKLELTESMMLENIEKMIDTMRALNEISVQFSLDDFGTGYSSLQYLKRLPLYQLKIDRSFVLDISTDSNDRAIVMTIIAMAQSMGLGVIAEGVETEEQRQFLFNKGCTHYQGYLFGKPIPVAQFEELLKRG